MRKFLIRWWYTSNWPQERTRQTIEEWHIAMDRQRRRELEFYLG